MQQRQPMNIELIHTDKDFKLSIGGKEIKGVAGYTISCDAGDETLYVELRLAVHKKVVNIQKNKNVSISPDAL